MSQEATHDMLQAIEEANEVIGREFGPHYGLVWSFNGGCELLCDMVALTGDPTENNATVVQKWDFDWGNETMADCVRRALREALLIGMA